MSGSLNLTSLRGLNCPADELATVVDPTLALVALIWFEPPLFCGIPLVNKLPFDEFRPFPEFVGGVSAGVYRSFIPLAAVSDSGTFAQSRPPSVGPFSNP